MSGEVIDGVVRPGPAPADAVRPAVVICDEQGEVRQAVVRLDDGTLVEVTAPEPDAETFALGYPEPGGPDLLTRWRMSYGLGSQCLDPRDFIRITGT